MEMADQLQASKDLPPGKKVRNGKDTARGYREGLDVLN
jgi:hypothetical protein